MWLLGAKPDLLSTISPSVESAAKHLRNSSLSRFASVGENFSVIAVTECVPQSECLHDAIHGDSFADIILCCLAYSMRDPAAHTAMVVARPTMMLAETVIAVRALSGSASGRGPGMDRSVDPIAINVRVVVARVVRAW